MRWHLLACLLGVASVAGAFAACASNGNSGDDGGGGGPYDATSEGSGDDSASDGRSFGDGNGGDSPHADAGGDAKPSDGSSGDALGSDGGGDDGSSDGPSGEASEGGDGGGPGDAGDGGGPGDAGDASVCGSTPTLHPGNGTSLFCPFGPDAGAPIYCALPTDQCCIGGFLGNNSYAPSDCESFGTTCTNPPDGGAHRIECEETVDCSNNNLGTICCAIGTTPVLDQTCNYYRGSGFKGTTCEQGAACGASEFQICESVADCPNNQTCTPFKATGLQLGFCQ
jgi:hypothetical protein